VASAKNVARVRRSSSRAHRSASSWCLSGHIPSRYICHLRAHSALHSSGSTSTTVRIMSPQSSAHQPPSPRRATHGAPVSPQRARVRTVVGSTSWWCRRKPVGCEWEKGVGAAFTRAICGGDRCQRQEEQGGEGRMMEEGQLRTCQMPGRAAARKRHGDGEGAVVLLYPWLYLSRTQDFIPATNAASWPQTTSPVCAHTSDTFGNQVTRWDDVPLVISNDLSNLQACARLALRQLGSNS
jgi:hypothetical protein